MGDRAPERRSFSARVGGAAALVATLLALGSVGAVTGCENEIVDLFPAPSGPGAAGENGTTPFDSVPPTPCFENRDCPNDAYCDTLRGVCLASCRSDDQCPNARPYCISPDNDAGKCVECFENHHCDDNPAGFRVCMEFVGVCVECETNSDCEPPRDRCLDGFLRCVGCVSDFDCDNDSFCALDRNECVQFAQSQ